LKTKVQVKPPTNQPLDTERGFSLIEVLIVMGIIAAISAVILPNLGLTQSSQASLALRDLTNTIRATYDSAVLEGGVHRLVLHVSKSEYWTEAAPKGYEGRPPLSLPEGFSASETFKADSRTRLVEELEKANEDARKHPDKEDKKYSQRSFLVTQQAALRPVKWNEVNDPVLFKRSLPGSAIFAAAATENMSEKMTFERAEEKDFVYIYFFPQGQVEQAMIQLGVSKEAKVVDMEGPKFSVFIDALSGHSEILEGFQEPEFLQEGK
jgi:prepilin-type N-terminal cleavage/methylation domain-containing protein